MNNSAELKTNLKRIGMLVLVAIFASGCASLGSTGGRSSEQSTADKGRDMTRAERVFLYQSRVADQLMDRYPLFELFENAEPAVTEAEARMTESCSPLTQAVLARIAGEKPSLGLRFRVISTIDDCERAARKMHRMLGSSAVADSI